MMSILASTTSAGPSPTWLAQPARISTAMATLTARQLWNLRPDTSTTDPPHCTPFTLPANGILSFGESAITLTTEVVFQPQCTGITAGEVFSNNLKDDFYASTTPMTYVIAAATVIAWILVIMLLITPRTALFGNLSGGPALGGGHGMIGGASSGPSFSGSGARPWLQKAATLMVAISLTIATSDTFDVAYYQYNVGYMDAYALRDAVLGSTEIRVVRVISDIFLWLAQVQTLIRLFPRHKEKVLIKWIGFVLITFDTLFACLNSFLIGSTPNGRHFVEAVPALAYLFQLALGLLYAAWVIYFALTKYRYAFYHSKMKSICVIALLSLVAILTPVVFFVTDISNSNVAGWGDYVRWVGAAAASVVVWEWVDRIEALERDEKKDGILGREIFDGDEMLDLTPSEEVGWNHGGRHHRRRPRSDGNARGGLQTNVLEHGLNHVAQRFRPKPAPDAPQHFPLGRAHSYSVPTTTSDTMPGTLPTALIDISDRARQSRFQEGRLRGGPVPPAQVPTPISRADTASAASTVYVVNYDGAADIPQPVRRRADPSRGPRPAQGRNLAAAADARQTTENDLPDVAEEDEELRQQLRDREPPSLFWQSVPNPFKRKRASPPKEIQEARRRAATAAAEVARSSTPAAHNFSKWDVKNRLGVFAAETGERFRERHALRPSRKADDDLLPVIVVPAPPREQGHHHHRSTDNLLHGPAAADDDDDDTVIRTFAPTTAPHRDHQHPPTTTTMATTARDGGAVYAGPPRADDISPISRRGDLTIMVPLPPRSNPSRGITPAQERFSTGSPSSSSGSRGAT